MPTLHIVIPVFNEGPTLGRILDRVMDAPVPETWKMDVVVVDDGSAPDAAAAARSEVERVAAHAAPTRRIRLLVHPQNRGKGAALMTGFDDALARAREEDAVLVQDADLEYDPADYPALLDALQRAPAGTTAVFGNRWGSGTHRTGAYRRFHALGNGLLTALSNAMTGLRVHDMECCYKLIPVPLLRCIRPRLSEARFGIEPQITAALARVGATVAEVPVRYAPRTFAEGKKIRWTDGVRALVVIARERVCRPPPEGAERGTLGAFITPWKALMQGAGFLVGVALLVWVIHGAVQAANDPDSPGLLTSLRAAWQERPWLLAGLVITTAVSLMIDGALFWLVLLPVRRLGFMELQWVTYAAAFSNFFPVRLGIAVRYLYHLRANRLTFMQCTGWFAAVTAVILASLAAVVAATTVDPHLDLWWVVIMLGALAVLGLLLRRLALLELVRRRVGAWNAVFATPHTYWAGTLLRVGEVLLWILRMWCAAQILNLEMSFSTIAILGVAAIAVMLNPLGRIGFREATTAAVASWLAGGGLNPDHIDGAFKQLAVLESFGEMLTTIPMGLVALPMMARWYRRRRAQPAWQAGGSSAPYDAA